MSIQSRLSSLVLAGAALSLLPITIACLCLNYAVLALSLRTTLRSRIRRNRGFQRRTVLITGVSTPQGLHLARVLYETGHDVVGAHAESRLLPSHARYSVAVSEFRRLSNTLEQAPSQYIDEILGLIEEFNIELWIDCSQQRICKQLRQAKTIVERRSRCLCFLPSDELAAAFDGPEAFLAMARSHGLPTLESRYVKSRGEVHDVLNESRGKKKYLLSSPKKTNPKTLLPRRTPSQTYNDLSKFKFQDDTQWQLKQHVDSQEKYITAAIVVRGEVKVFAASPASDQGLQALPPSSALNKALINYVQALVAKLGTQYTGHLCIDFCAYETASASGVEKSILPTDGRIGPEAALLLFQGLDGSLDLTRSYLSILTPYTNGIKNMDHEHDPETPTHTEKGLYSFSYDVVHLVLLPFVQLLQLRMRPVQFARNVLLMINHIAFWHEYIYDAMDPLPFWWLYQVYMPVVLIVSAFSRRTRVWNDMTVTIR